MFSEDLAHIQAFQEMTGQSTGLILDANQSYDQAAARKWETWFSGWQNVLWFEEPMPFDDLAEYRMLRSALSVPVAGGENVKGAKPFLPIFLENAVDIAQPDVMHCEGTDEFQTVLKARQAFRKKGLSPQL